MIRTLLVEDHELERLGLSIMLEQAENIELIGQAENGLMGVELAKSLLPDVIVMDIGLPIIDGIEATKRIKSFNPESKILIFTSRDNSDDIFEAFQSGADGYVMKDASREQICTAIRSVSEGAAWIDPAIAKLVLSNIQSPKNQTTHKISGEINYQAGRQNYGLTEREMEVLALIVEGLTNIQIADELTITAYTAKAHVHSVLQKLSAATRAKATKKAITEGLV
ncbi:MAG: response regulator transcription factor [Candidatus Gastranaerophilales bacterium]|nr:response regulator transcription factor [Candidatus Gastranaerophilales bacterium]